MKLNILVQNATAEDIARIDRYRAYLEHLGGLESITVLDQGTQAPLACWVAIVRRGAIE